MNVLKVVHSVPILHSSVAHYSDFGAQCSICHCYNNHLCFFSLVVGSQQDMIVNVWDWHNNIKVASNKISTKVKAISFAENGNYFVTGKNNIVSMCFQKKTHQNIKSVHQSYFFCFSAGNRHIKFWYLEYSRSKYKEPVPLMGRSAILGEQRNNYFCDVACGKGDMGDSTFAVTRSGLLCEFNNRRLLDKWVELKVR